MSARASFRVIPAAIVLVSVPLLAGPVAAATDFVHCAPFVTEGPSALATAAERDSTRQARFAGGTRVSGSGTGAIAPMRAAGLNGTWEELIPKAAASNASNMIVDPARDRLVLFGQSGYREYSNDVWVRPLSDDRIAWTLLTVPGPHPGATIAGTSIRDPVRDRLIIYGGAPADGVWAMSLSGTPAWTRLAAGGDGPASRQGIVGVYDPDGDRMIILGGYGGVPTTTMDVWAFALGDGSGWSRLTVSGVPPGNRSDYVAIYDSLRHRIVLFSGLNYPDADVWALSLRGSLAWEQLHPVGDSPPQLGQAAAAYDPVHDLMVVYGGVESGVGALEDAWVLRFADVPTWSHVAPAVRPVARNSPCMVYDGPRDRFVMFGGGISDTWSLTLTPSPAWKLLEADSGIPYPLYLTAALYDSTRHRLLRYGGHLIYFVHGTQFGAESNELWGMTAGEFARWTQVRGNAAGPPLGGMSMILDPVADRLITYGGYSSYDGTFGDLWQTSLSDTTGWKPLDALGTVPPARELHAGVADPVRRRLFVFGGRGFQGVINDTWMLDLNGPPQWTQLDSTAITPPPRLGHSAVYDPVGDRILMFGGLNNDSGTLGDTWQLTLGGTPAWSRVVFPVSPPPRAFAAMVYDSRRQRIVLFGGRDPLGQPLRDTWYLPLGSGAGWVLGDSSGTLPQPRWGEAAVYDPDQDRLVLSDGTVDPCGYPAVLWELMTFRFSDPVPTPLVLRRVERHPQSVTLEWQAGPEASFVGTIERRTESGSWSVLSPVTPDATGLVRFDDHGMSPGVRYAYRVRWSVGPAASTTEPVWVDVPPLRFALDRLPNPVSQGLAVSLSLPDAAEARLEVFDVAGRRFASRRVGELGAGDHVVQLGARGSLAPGMYVIRLTRAGESRVAHVAILH
jgi:hypothetical protein